MSQFDLLEAAVEAALSLLGGFDEISRGAHAAHLLVNGPVVRQA